jgi:hypothetical protein
MILGASRSEWKSREILMDRELWREMYEEVALDKLTGFSQNELLVSSIEAFLVDLTLDR